MLMHETMVAQSLFEAILAEADKHHARPVSARLTCGQLNSVNEDVLVFAFAAVSRGSVCEGLTLEIVQKPLAAHCTDCDRDFRVDLEQPRCSHCGGRHFTLLPDPPLVLEEIEFETE